MVEPLQMASASSSRPLSKKPSARNLNIVPPTGARPKLGRSATLASHYPSPPNSKHSFKKTQGSPGRGLTVRIDSGMGMPVHNSNTSNSNSHMHSLRSAPARTVRRLPAVPGGARSPGDGPSQSEPATPFTAPMSMGYFDERGGGGRRAVRPLPCPPCLSPSPPTRVGVDGTITPTTSPLRTDSPETESCLTTPTPTPTARPRSVKPLPVPKVKVEPFVLQISRVSSAAAAEVDGLSDVRSTSTQTAQVVDGLNLDSDSSTRMPGVPPPTQPEDNNMVSDVQVSPQNDVDDGSTAQDLDLDWDADIDLDWEEEDEDLVDDVEEGVIQLGNRIVLRKISNISLDSDLTSEEDEAADCIPIPVAMRMGPLPTLPVLKEKDVNVVSKAGREREKEEEEHIDYSWVLSNRVLYRQCDPQFNSKWIRERKGKRYTEQDYENIIQALRTL